MKLNWSRTFLLGLGFMTVNVVWLMYNVFVPIFLQSGSPTFDSRSTEFNTLGFGLDSSVAGVVMALDNIVAIFLLPLVGVWSDHTRTRIGKRYPYILGAAPVAALAIIGIAIGANAISPQHNGSVGDNSLAFIIFSLAILVTLIAMAIYRTPVIALMADVTPSPLRNKANGVIDFMGGVGGIIATLAIIPLFDSGFFLPFVATSVTLIVANLLLFTTVKEPIEQTITESNQAARTKIGLISLVRALPGSEQRSLLLIMAAIFGWFVGFNTVEAFFSSYAVTTLQLTLTEAGRLFSAALISFIVFSIPTAFIGTAIGRKRSILLGIVIFGLALLSAFFTVDLVMIAIILIASGFGFAMINTNSLPMILELGQDKGQVGAFTGLYYFASQLAAVVAPILNGIIVSISAGDFRVIFVVCPLFLLVSLVAMALTTEGEVRSDSSPA